MADAWEEGTPRISCFATIAYAITVLLITTTNLSGNIHINICDKLG